MISTVVVLQPAVAVADDLAVVAITHAGRTGFFVPSTLFREMDLAFSQHDNLLAQIEALKAQARALEDELDAKRRELAIAEDRLKLRDQALLDAMADADADAAAIEQLGRDAQRAWYESPGLWFGIGALAALIVDGVRPVPALRF